MQNTLSDLNNYLFEQLERLYDDDLSDADLDRVPYIEQAFENISAIDAVSEWIPCSERLPKGQGYYICTCKDGSKYNRATVVKWSNGWQLTGARAYWIVLAWMPLPNPWKGADDEAD